MTTPTVQATPFTVFAVIAAKNAATIKAAQQAAVAAFEAKCIAEKKGRIAAAAVREGNRPPEFSGPRTLREQAAAAGLQPSVANRRRGR